MTSTWIQIQWSHAGTVVPECYKDDVESQWKSLKFDPPPSENAWTDGYQISRGDYVPDVYRCAKLHFDPIRGFGPHICEVAYQTFTRLVFWGSSNSLPPTPLRRFWRSIRQKRRFAQGCAFWGPRTNLYILTSFSPKTQILWSIFDGT